MLESFRNWAALIFVVAGMSPVLKAHCTLIEFKNSDGHRVVAQKVKYATAVISNSMYLKQEKRCVGEAIRFLGITHTKCSIPRLTELLEYQARDATYTPDIYKRYPAIGGLSNMGEDAVPTLVAVVEENDPASIKSKNAIAALMNMPSHRQDPGKVLSILDKAAEKQNDATRVARLNKAVEEARVNWCAAVSCTY
jgi:hypothetical protein